MNILLPIIIIVGIILIVLVLKLIKGLIKVALLGLIIFLVISSIFGYLLIKDISEFTKGITNNQNKFFLKEYNELTTGFTIKGFNISSINTIDIDYNSEYEQEDFETILGDSYKLFIFDKKAFPDEEFTFDNLQKEFEDEIDEIQVSEGYIFALTIINNLRKDPGFIVKEYKNNNVMIYPKNLIFKVIDYTKDEE